MAWRGGTNPNAVLWSLAAQLQALMTQNHPARLDRLFMRVNGIDIEL